MINMQQRLILGCLFAAAGVAVAHAQWLNYPAPGVPRLPNGNVDLAAKAPRTAEGHPDLSGVWMHEPTPISELRRLYGSRFDDAAKLEEARLAFHKYVWNILIDFPDRDSIVRPQTQPPAPRRGGACAPGPGVVGFPVAGLLAAPIKIVQAPRLTMILYEIDNDHRQIFTDGRTLPTEINLPAYLGYSVGRWEGDTFVVETTGFNDKTSLDNSGHRHSDQLRVVERYRRPDFGHLDVEMTFDDPKFYTRPFTIHVPHNLLADAEIFEMFPENEKDCAHLTR